MGNDPSSKKKKTSVLQIFSQIKYVDNIGKKIYRIHLKRKLSILEYNCTDLAIFNQNSVSITQKLQNSFWQIIVHLQKST